MRTRAGRALAAGAVIALLTGCGDSGPSADKIEADLQQAVRANQSGSELADVTCVHEEGARWRCAGDYTASREAVHEDLGGVDTSDFTQRDWAAMVEQASGPVTFQVTVGDDGEFVYEPTTR